MFHKDAQDQLEIGDQVKIVEFNAKYKPGIWIFEGYSKCKHAGSFGGFSCDCKGRMRFVNSYGESFSDCLNYTDQEYIPIEYIIKKLDDNLFEI